MSVQDEPLSEPELDRLDEFLRGHKSGKAMNIEEVDGFFCALIAGPEIVMPSEYLSEVFGSETSETLGFNTVPEADEILGLLIRHWNEIAKSLSKREAYLPLLLEDENGLVHGNDWARGFIRGTRLRQEGWADLLNDDDHSGCMIPMLMLCHEHDEDPAMRPGPISPKQREKLIMSMAAGLVGAYVYFREPAHPRSITPREPQQFRVKIGRNDLCPCGSGKKYKRCCGGMTVQ